MSMLINMQLTHHQEQVFDMIKAFMESDCSVFILRGYAGTGKTTMVKHIADYVSSFGELKLMAPTGRAARVLEEKTNYTATTIHKGIYSGLALWDNQADDIAETQYKMIFPVKTAEDRVIAIVDEASMLSSMKNEHELFVFGTDILMDDLLTFIRPSFGGKVIFVGDPAQLPPVGDNTSHALRSEYFEEKGLLVMQAELTEVIRQSDDSVILRNAVKIRELLLSDKRNTLVFDQRAGEVESLAPGNLLDRYLFACKEKGRANNVLICYSNKAAAKYNTDIRRSLYSEESPSLRTGDILMVIQNDYNLNKMNGEFLEVLGVGDTHSETAPVYVQEGVNKVKKNITLNFIEIKVEGPLGTPVSCYVFQNLLEDEKGALGINEQRALYINFKMRHQNLKPHSEEFKEALKSDAYFNCLKAKYGYAVTGHKCQGGEWETAFVDYSGRTGLSDDCLRWAYTSTTRARKTLYIVNRPNITAFKLFRFEELQECSKIPEEFRCLNVTALSPMHDSSDPDFLHAKYWCIASNLEHSPYSIDRVDSRPYLEMYWINTGKGVERYDIRYKKGGLFSKASTQVESEYSAEILRMLDDESDMPMEYEYEPTDNSRKALNDIIQLVCDTLDIKITNIVDHPEDYSIMYYFNTMSTFSYIKIYINDTGFVSYAKPMSLIGKDDTDMLSLIEEIKKNLK